LMSQEIIMQQRKLKSPLEQAQYKPEKKSFYENKSYLLKEIKWFGTRKLNISFLLRFVACILGHSMCPVCFGEVSLCKNATIRRYVAQGLNGTTGKRKQTPQRASEKKRNTMVVSSTTYRQS